MKTSRPMCRMAYRRRKTSVTFEIGCDVTQQLPPVLPASCRVVPKSAQKETHAIPAHARHLDDRLYVQTRICQHHYGQGLLKRSNNVAWDGLHAGQRKNRRNALLQANALWV